MPDIKSDKQMEKSPPLNEKIFSSIEAMRQKMGQEVEAEKMQKIEQARKTIIEEIAQAENQAPATVGPISAVSAPQVKLQKQVENVLAGGLAEIYLGLAPDKRKEFKKAGEETAKKISQLLAKAKINIREIIRLIKKWLS